MADLVYDFSEGAADQRELLGGKGANLCEMARLGLPVPPGFVITTEACKAYLAHEGDPPHGLFDAVRRRLEELERATGRRFGSRERPLLVSVRSGAPVSMPGMMDTILNLGLNAEALAGLAEETGNQRFACDVYRRFIQLFANVVMHVPHERFEAVLAKARTAEGVASDGDLSVDALRDVINRFLAVVRRGAGQPLPADPWQQLERAILAVFESWNNDRAIRYRRHHNISDDLGTATVVQAMAFGNIGDDSGSGVLFSRDPATGERRLYGEFLLNAQGEDIVAGLRTPRPLTDLAQVMPHIYRQLEDVADLLERHYRDAQDVEFTIERGKLYILQTRSAKRTPAAAVRIATEMADEGLITWRDALLRVQPDEVSAVLLPRFDEAALNSARADSRLLARGLNASPGVATGCIALDADSAEEAARRGKDVILFREETSADDIRGILVAQAVVTARGGITSHAAVVTRGLGKPAVVGCAELRLDGAARLVRSNGVAIPEGDIVSVDGFSGEVFMGSLPRHEPDISGNESLRTLLAQADSVRRLRVMTNTDDPAGARLALGLGAEGIGLCRTEHMFFDPRRLPIMQKMLFASAEMDREAADSARSANGKGRLRTQPARRERDLEQALVELENFQREDFRRMFEVMAGRPVTIRLLDAPLHEFLPSYEALVAEVAAMRQAGGGGPRARSQERELALVREMREVNPMLGHRGCRLGLTHPVVYEMQARAILKAAADVEAQGIPVHPEIMIPMVSHANELRVIKARLSRVARQVEDEVQRPVSYRFGTMIELPRAALAAAQLARDVDFFSFGSNDLTQTVFGFSRDDAGEEFLNAYLDEGILPADPFVTLDQQGVGRLIQMACWEGREAQPDLSLGLCGEHGGDPESIAFCQRSGIDYVSCSPPRVPAARLAAAQAALLIAEEDRRRSGQRVA